MNGVRTASELNLVLEILSSRIGMTPYPLCRSNFPNSPPQDTGSKECWEGNGYQAAFSSFTVKGDFHNTRCDYAIEIEADGYDCLPMFYQIWTNISGEISKVVEGDMIPALKHEKESSFA